MVRKWNFLQFRSRGVKWIFLGLPETSPLLYRRELTPWHPPWEADSWDTKRGLAWALSLRDSHYYAQMVSSPELCPLCPFALEMERTPNQGFRCFSPIMKPLLVPQDDWLLFWAHLPNWREAKLKILPSKTGFKTCSRLLVGEICWKP